MARDVDEITRSMAETTELINPNVDTSKGPVYETAHYPWAVEIAKQEAANDALAQRYQFETADRWSTEEIASVGRDYGMSLSQGTPSQGYLTFYAYEIKVDTPIEEGTLGSTSDGRYFYKTLQSVTFFSANVAAYFVASRRRYEITVPAEAVEIGPDYDCAEGSVNVLQTPIPGVSGVTGSEFRGGSTNQSLQEFVDDLRAVLLGNALGTPGGLASLGIRFTQGVVEDTAVLTPADIGVFERLPSGMVRSMIDIYVIGSRLGVTDYTYTTSGTETTIVLPETPLLEVTAVLVDGVAATYTIIRDTAPATRGTVFAQDAINLDAAPGPGHTVYVAYSYNALVFDFHNYMNESNAQLFRTDAIVREGKQVPVDIELVVTSYGAGARVTDVESLVTRWFRDPTLLTSRQHFVLELDPKAFADDLAARLSVSVVLNKFNRPDRATMMVQPIIFAPHEYPVVNLRVVAL